MVTEPQQVDTPQEELEAEEANPIIAEIARLNRAEEEETSQLEAPTPPTETAPTILPVAEAPPTGTPPAPSPEITAPGLPEAERQRLVFLEQQNAEYERQRHAAEEQRALAEYQQSLITQGFTDEQAAFVAQQINQERQRRVQVEQQALASQQYYQGKMNAAAHYGQKYGVGPSELLSYDTPQTMEMAAKQIKENRELRERIGKLEKSQVPAQRFENGQGSAPAPAGNQTWLDRYNRGDRSEQARTAAREAAGM